jgi:hypothetical protein
MDWQEMSATIRALYASPPAVVNAAIDIIQRAGH